MLSELRKELLQAQGAGEDTALRFQIEDIEVELNIAATQEDEGGVGVKFWVLDASGKLKDAEVRTQRVKLKLKVVDAAGKSNVKIGSEATGRPD
jgi:YbbR domain-containing protein